MRTHGQASALPRQTRQDRGRSRDQYVETNVEADRLGFYSTFLVEHHFSGFGQVSASLDFLGWVAARTSAIRVGTAVLVLPWHDPVLLAERAATLDLLSGGRLDFGVGKGYRIIAGLQALQAVGVGYVLMSGGDATRQSMQRFAADVMPTFVQHG